MHASINGHRATRTPLASRGSFECTGRALVPLTGPCREPLPGAPAAAGFSVLEFYTTIAFGNCLIYVANYKRYGPREPHTPHVEAVSAQAGLSYRSPGRAAPNPPPGAGFSVLEIINTIAFGGSWIRSRQLQTIQISRDSHASRGGREGTRRALVPFRISSDPSGRGLLGSKKNSAQSPLAAA